MTQTFPSTAWFRALAERMAAQPQKYRNLGSMDLTLLPRIVFPDGHAELYGLAFEGHRCRSVDRLPDVGAVRTRHPVVIEGEYAAWREMIENIRANAGPDLTHSLNYLTFPDYPMRVTGPDQLEVDAFYRYNQSLQRFFNGAAVVPTVYAA